MNITPEYLMELTATMPMKQIDVLGKPYLQRYFAGSLFGGEADVWIHRFLSCDGDRHLHNHPWQGISFVLHGGYLERYQNDRTELADRMRRACNMSPVQLDQIIAGEQTDLSIDLGEFIGIEHWHRIVRVQPETWTLMIVDHARESKWWFRDDAGALEEMTASPADWWKACRSRDQSDGAVQ
ncbi:hypothetical protein [Pseudohongiella spirulinae]|uniref:Uncharacterized protein n=1 Tax=Pseudohongiella spirulinae TaxID=1249552 RepID=A0A0S2KE32_9GAMM|nr:hypothetical protein [Pseudohongiella spirulinae]ALO46588.1 hypothetical protein PS2015_1944 [Pseudohongiella spirulinae]